MCTLTYPNTLGSNSVQILYQSSLSLAMNVEEIRAWICKGLTVSWFMGLKLLLAVVVTYLLGA